MTKLKTKQQSISADQSAGEGTRMNAQTTGSALPLFYQSPAILEVNRHAKAGVVATKDMDFARHANSLPLNAIEFLEAIHHYPIVFTQHEKPMPVAVVGFEQENYFVSTAGQWREDCYIPAYVRQYPFIFFEREEDKRFYLCIDEAAPHFQAEASKEALPLFEQGKATPIAEHALEFCTSYYQHHALTQNFCQALVTHKLLTPYESSFTSPSGRVLQLSGFQMIDEKALNALDDGVFLEFRRNGWLAFIYLALASSSNWKRLAALAPKN